MVLLKICDTAQLLSDWFLVYACLVTILSLVTTSLMAMSLWCCGSLETAIWLLFGGEAGRSKRVSGIAPGKITQNLSYVLCSL